VRYLLFFFVAHKKGVKPVMTFLVSLADFFFGFL